MIRVSKGTRQLLSTLPTYTPSRPCSFGSLLQKLYSWHDLDDVSRRSRRPNKAKDDNICLNNILACYQAFLSEAGEDVPEIKNVIKSGLPMFLRQAGDELRDTLQVHIRVHVPELLERLKEHNRIWTDDEEGRPMLSSIDENGRFPFHDAISLFYILNSHLPTSQQIAFIPEGGFGVKFFTITEEALMKVLVRDAGDRNTSLMRTIFGKTALEYVNEHPGNLIHPLFFSKHLDYTRSTCLVNPDTDKRASARGIFDVDSGTKASFDALSERTRTSRADDTYARAKRDFQTFSKSIFRAPEEQNAALDAGTDWKQ
ncbi:hypothetical protein BGX28_005851 [Mortierella sp. GBA30]|nr:hypothetical protein BGX28_005851 [Mortierella sp. GBA30]